MIRLLLPLLFLPGLAAAATFDEVRLLARAGAPELAVELLDREQPAVVVDAEGWSRWERERVEILAENGRWRELGERLARLPEGLPRGFYDWARGRRAAALLELGQGEAALAELRRLLWNGAVTTDAYPAWRQMIIRAYLIEGRVEDAHTAMLRYQQDYGDGGEAWQRLRARVLIRAGRHADALTLLAGDGEPGARALALLAELRRGQAEPGEIRLRADRLAARKGVAEEDRLLAWMVSAEAAGLAGEYDRRLRVLEKILALPHLDGNLGELFTVGADDLWQTLLDYGIWLGNQRQLLVGQEQPWYAAANEAAAKHPLQAMALLVVVAFNEPEPAKAALAHRQFLQLLLKQRDGARLMERLYLESKRYPALVSLPQNVRYLLLDQALARGEIPLASRLMESLARPPEGEDTLEWSARRARVSILAGEVERGVAILEALLKEGAGLKAEQLDRLIQVVFDLQSLGHHDQALALFGRLRALSGDPRQRRELQFWMGDSHKAQGRFREAARLYLLSAVGDDPYALDQWSQSARYAAAEALAKAGLRGDAHSLYRTLYAATKDPERKAVLRQRMQELWLVDGAPEGE